MGHRTWTYWCAALMFLLHTNKTKSYRSVRLAEKCRLERAEMRGGLEEKEDVRSNGGKKEKSMQRWCVRTQPAAVTINKGRTLNWWVTLPALHTSGWIIYKYWETSKCLPVWISSWKKVLLCRCWSPVQAVVSLRAQKCVSRDSPENCAELDY